MGFSFVAGFNTCPPLEDSNFGFYLEAISKIGFWLKVKADVRFEPEE